MRRGFPLAIDWTATGDGTSFQVRNRREHWVAVDHAILVIAYHLLQRGTDYQDLGPRYFEERDRDAEHRRLVHRLERLGYKVSLDPSAA